MEVLSLPALMSFVSVIFCRKNSFGSLSSASVIFGNCTVPMIVCLYVLACQVRILIIFYTITGEANSLGYRQV